MGWYDTAEVCENGHVINLSTKEYPQHRQRFCSKCGARTITQCAACTADIRGRYNVDGVLVLGGSDEPPPPAFCHECGTAYRWTQSRLMAARELAMDLTALTREERDLLAKSLDDLVRDTPSTALAATRFKWLVAKTGVEVTGAFRAILYDVVSDKVRGLIWGGVPPP